MTDLVNYQLSDGIATLTLNNGRVNAISPPLIDALHAALDRAQSEGAVVVLTGQVGVFSAGFDLKVMTSSRDNAIALVTAGSLLARRMLAHPQPVIAACSGHAVAKGAFLLLAADYRVGAEGPYSIGLNEVQIGMTMHHVGIALARDRLLPAAFQRAVINAEMFTPHGAVAAGFLDAVVAPQDLMQAAHSMAQHCKKLHPGAHHQTKLKARKDLLDTLDAAIALDKVTGLGA